MTDTLNNNLHYTNKWRLALLRSPTVQYNCTAVEFPSISLQPIALATPVGKHFVGGKVVDFGQFTFTFTMDEDFENYMNIFNWMTGIAGSVDMIKYKELTTDIKKNIFGTDGHNIYSDGTLFSLTNSSNINREFNIINMFPVSLGSPQFSRSEGNIVNTCTATFQCDYFELAPKNS